MQVTIDGVPYAPASVVSSRIGIAISTHQRADVLKRALEQHMKHLPADYAVGDAYGGAVVYTCYSLVDHADGEPVERHPDSAPRTERRRAWRLA